MKRNLGYCLPCYEAKRTTPAVQLIDGDPYCLACLRPGAMATAQAILAPEPDAEPAVPFEAIAADAKAEAPQQPQKGHSTMDTLKARVIKRSQIPAPKQRIQGRLGELWTKLQLLSSDEVLEVENRDTKHAGSTSRAVQMKAKRDGRKIVAERRDATLYFWWAHDDNRSPKGGAL